MRAARVRTCMASIDQKFSRKSSSSSATGTYSSLLRAIFLHSGKLLMSLSPAMGQMCGGTSLFSTSPLKSKPWNHWCFLITRAPPLTTPRRLVGLSCSSFFSRLLALLVKCEGKISSPFIMCLKVSMGFSSK